MESFQKGKQQTNPQNSVLSKKNKYADFMGIMTGWGEDGNGNRPKTLKKAMVSIASNEECGSENKLQAIDREAKDGPCGVCIFMLVVRYYIIFYRGTRDGFWW